MISFCSLAYDLEESSPFISGFVFFEWKLCKLSLLHVPRTICSTYSEPKLSSIQFFISFFNLFSFHFSFFRCYLWKFEVESKRFHRIEKLHCLFTLDLSFFLCVLVIFIANIERKTFFSWIVYLYELH